MTATYAMGLLMALIVAGLIVSFDATLLHHVTTLIPR